MPRDWWCEREVRVLICEGGEIMKVSALETNSHGDRDSEKSQFGWFQIEQDDGLNGPLNGPVG